MSSYALLRPLLAAVAAGAGSGMTASVAPPPSSEALPAALGAAGSDAAAQARSEVALAERVLGALADARPADALSMLAAQLDAPLRPSPFETLLEEAGARLAGHAHEADLATRFLERRRAYLERYGAGAILAALDAIHRDPDLRDALEETLGPPEAEAATPQPPHNRPPVPGRVPSGLVPFAAEPERPAYVVTVRHLEDARTATFAVHRVAWHDLASDDPTVSDLVLAFEHDARPMLRRLDSEMLRLRLFFGEGSAFDEIATADGSLFDVEINPTESRIYLKLRRPVAWSATDLPVAEFWSHLHSCVLISEDG